MMPTNPNPTPATGPAAGPATGADVAILSSQITQATSATAAMQAAVSEATTQAMRAYLAAYGIGLYRPERAEVVRVPVATIAPSAVSARDRVSLGATLEQWAELAVEVEEAGADWRVEVAILTPKPDSDEPSGYYLSRRRVLVVACDLATEGALVYGVARTHLAPLTRLLPYLFTFLTPQPAAPTPQADAGQAPQDAGA